MTDHPHRVTQVVEKCARCEKLLELQEIGAATLKRIGIVIIGLLPLIWVTWYVITRPPKPEHRTTKCYFVRHARYEGDEHRFHPWDPWRVWESPNAGGSNLPASGEGFASKAAAWEFILKWNLEPCR